MNKFLKVLITVLFLSPFPVSAGTGTETIYVDKEPTIVSAKSKAIIKFRIHRTDIILAKKYLRLQESGVEDCVLVVAKRNGDRMAVRYCYERKRIKK